MEKNYLYRVTLKGLHASLGTNKDHGTYYVVSKNTEDAYQKVRKYLNELDYGFDRERELDKIEVIADDYFYGDANYMLFI